MRLLVEVWRSGGFAGVQRRARLDAAGLSAGAREALATLIERAAFFRQPGRLPGGTPDAIAWRLAVRFGEQRHAVRFEDPGAPEALLELARYAAESGEAVAWEADIEV